MPKSASVRTRFSAASPGNRRAAARSLRHSSAGGINRKGQRPGTLGLPQPPLRAPARCQVPGGGRGAAAAQSENGRPQKGRGNPVVARTLTAPGRRRRGAGVLGCARSGLPRNRPSAVLVPQDGKRAQCLAQVIARQGEGGSAGDLDGTDPQAGRPSLQALHINRYGAKYPKATEKLERDREALLAFFAFPAEHWVHLRTTNPIESTFATVRHRTGRTKNCVTRATFLGLAFKMSEEAAKTWRRIRAPEKVAELLGGARYDDGIPVSDDLPETQEEQREAA